MFETSIWRNPVAWSRRLVGSRRRFVIFCATMLANALVLIIMELLTLAAFKHGYGELGKGWQPLSLTLAVGLAAFIGMTTTFFPILLATALRGVLQVVNEKDQLLAGKRGEEG